MSTIYSDWCNKF